ncbi:MAG: ATP-binding protein [Bradymonadia bacterium]
MKTNLSGRVRNVSLSANNCLVPLAEALTNSIHAIEDKYTELSDGRIDIEIHSSANKTLVTADTLGVVNGFTVVDNGIGLDEKNFKAFRELDTSNKQDRGCKGVGRLMYLKVFDVVEFSSAFKSKDSELIDQRHFSFSDSEDAFHELTHARWTQNTETGTIVKLKRPKHPYAQALEKIGVDRLRTYLSEEILWYLVRQSGCPKINVNYGNESFCLNDYLLKENIFQIKQIYFEIENQKFCVHTAKTTNTSIKHAIYICAANRKVRKLNFKDIGVLGGWNSFVDTDGKQFNYLCFVESQFFNDMVNQERTEFSIRNGDEGELALDLSWKDIHRELARIIQAELKFELSASLNDSFDSINTFVQTKAPKYKTLINRIKKDELYIDPNAKDDAKERMLHELYLKEVRNANIKLRELASLDAKREPYGAIEKVYKEYVEHESMLRSVDLTEYALRRKAVIDVLRMAIERQNGGDYNLESYVHNIVMPMGTDSSDDVLSRINNLWLIDERLQYYDYISSDKPIKKILNVNSSKRPDLLAVKSVESEAERIDKQDAGCRVLISDNNYPSPLNSMAIYEFKRPMRENMSLSDCVQQTLNYVDLIKRGSSLTNSGRRIDVASEDIPCFAYIICDISPALKRDARNEDFTPTSDNQGLFKYYSQRKLYLEILSYNRMLNRAQEMNRGLFEALGIDQLYPTKAKKS